MSDPVAETVEIPADALLEGATPVDPKMETKTGSSASVDVNGCSVDAVGTEVKAEESPLAKESDAVEKQDGADVHFDSGGEADAEGEVEAQRMIEIKPITIRLPAPTYAQTVPRQPTPGENLSSESKVSSSSNGKSGSNKNKTSSANNGTAGIEADSTSSQPTTMTIHPQSFETMQDVRASISDWLGGYWLGPYSLRIPGGSVPEGYEYVDLPTAEGEEAKKPGLAKVDSVSSGNQRGKLLAKGKESVEIRAGEKLADWLEVGEVFAWAEGLGKSGDKVGDVEAEVERVLMVQREPYSESEARQSILRLREYTMQSSDSSLPFQPVGVNAGSSVFEGIRDGTLQEVDAGRKRAGQARLNEKVAEENVAGGGKRNASSNGKVTRAGKPPVIVESAVAAEETDSDPSSTTFSDWHGWTRTEWSTIPTSIPAVNLPACYRSLVFSPFNPPPAHLRQRGHLLYATVVTLEGETLMLVCTAKGWHVARSTSPNTSFDPSPRTVPKEIAAHSLIDLMHGISPQFTSTLRSLQNPAASANSAREPIATVPIPQHPPAYPWLVDPVPLKAHTADLMRTQLAYGYTGATSVDALEGARDWNEELQNAREMPRGGTQERVLRERVLQKTHAEFTAACIKGTMAIGRGDLPPINPHEPSSAHMWLANNIFFTKGVNSVDAYDHLGGDEAAHVSHAKDAMGVKLLNKLDVDNVYLLGHTVIDWQGERWICQSVLPGIFSRRRDEGEPRVDEVNKQSEPKEEEIKGHAAKSSEEWIKVEGEASSANEAADTADVPKPTATTEDAENYLIIYGADSESGTAKLHWDAGMHQVMQQIASSQHSALHQVKDAQGKSFDFWTSADVKGLRGSDGRRYLLDLPRLSPVDVEWLEKDSAGELLPTQENSSSPGPSYPHRVTLLRPELVEAYWEYELKSWARKVHAQDEKKKAQDAKADDGEAEENVAAPAETKVPDHFQLTFNTDAFVEQAPAPGSASTERVPSQHADESDPSVKSVREASLYLRTIAIPAVVIDFIAANTFGILDGASLSKHLHSRGINMRYLGYLLAVLDKFLQGSEGKGVGQLYAIRAIILQEMVYRASKHLLRKLLHGLSTANAPNATAHFLNCLLGTLKNPEPNAEYIDFDFAPSTAPAYVSLTPSSLREQITAEVARRFRWSLDESHLQTGLKRPQLLRELALRFAFQLNKRDFDFEASSVVNHDREDTASGTASDDDVRPNGHGKPRKAKKALKVESTGKRTTTFEPADIIAMLPVVKSSAPSASVSEEIFEMGRATIGRGSVASGLELMLEGINMHEQIHQVVHPEVAIAYNQYAVAMHQLVRIRIQQIQAEAKEGDEEPALGLDVATAVKLQKQAIMAAERTLGLDNSETIGYYFNLAMLENVQGDHVAALRYFKHVIAQWDVAYGANHPELPSTLMHVAMILQTQGKHAACIVILEDVHRISIELYGKTHLLAGSAMNQLTQAHFLNGDITKALECAKQASEIFNTRLGPEDAQSKEAAKNCELLSGALEHNARVAAASQQQIEAMARMQEQKRAALLAANQRRRQALASVIGPSAIASSSKTPIESRQRATTDGTADVGDDIITSQAEVDELVKYIQAGGTVSGDALANKARGKHALRGKRRTGAKR